MSTIRAFIAIPLPGPILDQLARVQRKLEGQVPPRSIRWVKRSGIHLTLKFLGDVPRGNLVEMEKALREAARSVATCTYTVEGLGCFPTCDRPRVIWVGVVEPSGRLGALQDAVEEAMAPFGFEPERRGFTAHLTLGRVARHASRRDAASVGERISRTHIGALGKAVADRFYLIQSTLKPSGAEYARLVEFKLQSPDS